MHIEDVQDMIKIIEVGQNMILIKEVSTGIMQEVIKGMGGTIIITIIEEVVIEIKIMIGTGIGHVKDRIEIEGIREV